MQRIRRKDGAMAFTLTELLVVIAIIATLAALLMPAVSLARRHAQKTTTSLEIGQLQVAMEQFKQDFGVYPPDEYPPPLKSDGTPWDANRDGIGRPIELNSGECLVFFLGGGKDYKTFALGTSAGIYGDAGDPVPDQYFPDLDLDKRWFPYSDTTGVALFDRTGGPYFEFDLARLWDDDSDGHYVFVDGFGRGGRDDVDAGQLCWYQFDNNEDETWGFDVSDVNTRGVDIWSTGFNGRDYIDWYSTANPPGITRDDIINNAGELPSDSDYTTYDIDEITNY